MGRNHRQGSGSASERGGWKMLLAEAAFRVWELSRLSQGPREVGGGGGAGTSDLYQTNKLLSPVRPHGLQRQAPLLSLAEVRSDLLWKK